MYALVYIILILIPLAISLAVAVAPLVGKIFLALDYVLILMVVLYFVIAPYDLNPYSFLTMENVHTVFIILIFLGSCAAWFGIQRIRIFGIYVFKILACGFATYLVLFSIWEGYFGETLQEGVDTIWAITIAIIYFGANLYIRSQMSNESLFGKFQLPRFGRKRNEITEDISVEVNEE